MRRARGGGRSRRSSSGRRRIGRQSSRSAAVRVSRSMRRRPLAEWPTAGLEDAPAMIDFALTDENRLVQQTARAFAEAEILPAHPRVGREGRGPSRGLREDGRAGLPRRADPGGVRRRRAWTTSASRSCARSSSGPTRRSASSRASTSGSTRWRCCSGATEEQRQRWLVPQARGEKLATFGLTEPGVGTDAANLAADRPPRRRLLPPQRPEDLDQPRRHRRPLPRLRVGRPGEGRRGRHRVPRSSAA